MNIELGDKVKDGVTGFSGIVIAITHWLNGCARITIQPEKVGDDGRVIPSETIDANQIEIVKKGVHSTRRNDTGGPRPGPVSLSAPVPR